MNDREARREKIRARRARAFGSAKTAEELHAQLAFGRRCDACGGPPRIKIQSYVRLDELMERQPDLCAAIASRNPDGTGVPSFDSPHGRLVKLGDVVACAKCQQSAERSAAHPPTGTGLHPIVEIDRGPGADRVVVSTIGPTTSPDKGAEETAKADRARAQLVGAAAAVRERRNSEEPHRAAQDAFPIYPVLPVNDGPLIVIPGGSGPAPILSIVPTAKPGER